MNNDVKNKLIDFYRKSLEEYGTNDARSVHWSDEHSQEVRFDALVKIADLTDASILDVGSGLGDLYKYFITRMISVNYSGIDIMPEFVDRSRERFAEGNFMCGDAETLDNDYDYILASGALSFMVPEGKEHYCKMIKRMYEHSKKGLAFNMLNEEVHPSDDTYLSYNINEVVGYCKTLSPHVEVVTGYLPWDFTIYMYKK